MKVYFDGASPSDLEEIIKLGVISGVTTNLSFCKKQMNYGPSNISGGTSLRTEEDVKFSLMGLFFRMNDKVQRLKQLVVLGNDDTVGESIDDTYQDLSVYGIIAQIVKRQKWGQ